MLRVLQISIHPRSYGHHSEEGQQPTIISSHTSINDDILIFGVELPLIQAKLALLDEELTQHLAKEEAVLFPYVTKLERALATGSTEILAEGLALSCKAPRSA